MEKVIILVDVQNIYYTTKQAHNCNFDYNEFWAEVTKNRNVMKAIAYTTDRGDEKQRQFQTVDNVPGVLVSKIKKKLVVRIENFYFVSGNVDPIGSPSATRHRFFSPRLPVGSIA